MSDFLFEYPLSTSLCLSLGAAAAGTATLLAATAAAQPAQGAGPCQSRAKSHGCFFSALDPALFQLPTLPTRGTNQTTLHLLAQLPSNSLEQHPFLVCIFPPGTCKQHTPPTTIISPLSLFTHPSRVYCLLLPSTIATPPIAFCTRSPVHESLLISTQAPGSVILSTT